MKKILFVLTLPSKKDDLIKGMETVKEMLDSLNIEYDRIDVVNLFGTKTIPINIKLPYIIVDVDLQTAYEFYDDIYIIGNNDVSGSNGNNGYAFNVLSNIIDKTTNVIVNGSEVEVAGFKDEVINDYIKDSYVVGNNPKEIQEFIDIYLDNLRILSDTPEQSEDIQDLKIGLDVLYKRLIKIN